MAALTRSDGTRNALPVLLLLLVVVVVVVVV